VRKKLENETDEKHEIELVDASMVENCVCEEIKPEEVSEMLELGKKMIEYCFSVGAAGLAAPQIGVYKKMFVYRKTEDSFQIIFNPSFIKVSKRPMKVLEGCLTYKEKGYLVERYKEIQAIFYIPFKGGLKRTGVALKGEKSIYFQHETDHTNGITIKMKGVPQVGQKE
jgi:peptide deformylase